MTTTSDLILTVSTVTKDGGSYCVKCPHCKRLIGIEGNDMSEVRGEQYQHRNNCGGWLQVSPNARFVRELQS
jgi:hypothetical protein